MGRFVVTLADKIRLFEHVFLQADVGLFVETSEPLRAGAEVDLEVRFAATPDVSTTRAKVVAKRVQRTALQRAGVWLRVTPEAAEDLHLSLQPQQGEGAQVASRRSRRFECTLPVLVDKPIRQPFRCLNISRDGVRLAGVVPVPVGQTIRMTLEFGQRNLLIYGKVVWRREDERQTGVEFRFHDREALRVLSDEVRKIGAEHAFMVPSKATVLIVEDDPNSLAAFEQAFAAEGYGTVTAASVAEALATVRQQPPAAIILDVLLPGQNGVELCRALKRDAELSAVPVVLTSGLPPEDLGRLLEEAGALAALPKPFVLSAMTRLIDRILAVPPGDGEQCAGPGSEERRGRRRVPIFKRCSYVSETLRLETWLQDAAEDGLFIVSPWGEPRGTRARLTLMTSPSEPVTLTVEVVHRVDWGTAVEGHPARQPGLGLRVAPGTSQADFGAWLAGYDTDLNSKPVVLVVDDDRSHLELMSLVLAKGGFGVLTLDTPAAVPNAVAEARPNLVILDYMMPGIDGATLCKTLKQGRGTSAVPVWLYSSLSDHHLATLADECGADAYLTKGTRPSEIIARVTALLGTGGRD